jgi:hypothetical protein
MFHGVLSRLRTGDISAKDIAFLGARAVRHIPHRHTMKYIVRNNIVRDYLNFQIGREFGRANEKDIFYFLGQHPVGGGVARAEYLKLGDSAEGANGPGVFMFIEGMPLIVNINDHRKLEITNGTEGTAVSFIADPEADFLEIGYKTYLVTLPPVAVLAKFNVSSECQFATLEEKVVPLFSRNTTVTIKISKENASAFRSMPGERLSFKRKQVPCCPGFAITVNKAQSQTYDRAAIDLQTTFAKCTEADNFQSTYVALSRVKSADGLFFLREPSEEILYSKADPLLESDEVRYLELDRQTVSDAEHWINEHMGGA